MATITSQFETLLPSSRDLKGLGWPDWMINDYLSILRQIVLVSTASDDMSDLIEQLEQDLAALTIRVEANEIAIAENAQDILNLEYRVFGNDRPNAYLEAGVSYSVGDYVVNPSSDPQKYYKALESIADPAGVFDSSKWEEVNLISLEQYILDLEYRTYGDVRPSTYDETGTSYVIGDKIVNPSGDPQNYYRALENIAAPAGVFNPSQWREMSVSANSDRIESVVETVLEEFQYVAYGGLNLTTPGTSFSDLDGTYQTLTVFDATAFTTPRNITQNLVNDSLEFDLEGVYEVSVVLAFEHNEDNAGRQTNIRFYNSTDASSLGVIPVFIARNQPGTNINITLPVEVLSANTGDEIVIQLGGGDSVTSVSFDLAEYYIKSIGEYRGTL